MIIGISGKIGSGKDTIAKIIQYLTAKYTTEEIISILKNEGSYADYKLLSFSDETDWKIKKFAGKLKQIVSILTGVSIQDLEKQEVKDSLLPEEWQVYYILNWNKHRIMTLYSEQEAIDYCDKGTNSQHNFSYQKSERNYRWLMQYLGTNLFRVKLHSNAHVNALFSEYKPKRLVERTNIAEDWDNPKWLITDVRFKNEANIIIDKGGLLLRVVRNLNKPDTTIVSNEFGKKEISNEHLSETELDNYDKFDYTIYNNGTIEDLIEKVKEILIAEKLIIR